MITRGITVTLFALTLALVGLIASVGGLILEGAGSTVSFGIAFVAAASLVALSVQSTHGMPRMLALVMIAFAAILPEYAIDGYFARVGAGPEASGYSSLLLASTTSVSRLLIGLAWPMLIVLYWLKNRGERLELGSRHGLGLAIMLLAALYIFTIYIKGFVWYLDAVILLVLFGLYVWKAVLVDVRLRPFQRRAEAEGHVSSISRPISIAMFAYATLLIYLTAGPFADGLLSVSQGTAGGRFLLIQGITPLMSKLPWFALVGGLVWQSRSGFAVSTLLTSQVALMTLLMALLVVSPFMSGLVSDSSGVMELTSRQRTELLLMASQSIFLVALLSRLSLSWKGALAMALLFAVEWLLVGVHPDKDAVLIQGAFSAIYLGTAVVVFLADRSRLGLLAGAIAPGARAAKPIEDARTGMEIPQESGYGRAGGLIGVFSSSESGD